MDDNEYKRLCAQPDVMHRPDVRASMLRLRRRRPELATLLARILETDAVPRPHPFTGGPDSDYLWLDLQQGDLDDIADAFAGLEIEICQSEDRDTSRGDLSTVARLHDLWRNAQSSRPAV